jgi:hypothetical protein
LRFVAQSLCTWYKGLIKLFNKLVHYIVLIQWVAPLLAPSNNFQSSKLHQDTPRIYSS